MIEIIRINKRQLRDIQLTYEPHGYFLCRGLFTWTAMFVAENHIITAKFFTKRMATAWLGMQY